MAVLFLESFRYADDPTNMVGNRYAAEYFGTISTMPSSGRSCWRNPSGFNDRYMQSADFAAGAVSGSTVFVHFRYYIPVTPAQTAGSYIIRLGDSSNNTLDIRHASSGSVNNITLRRDDGTVVSTMDTTLSTNVEYSIGLLITLNDTTGAVTWYLNGVQRNTTSSIDTIGSTSTINRIRWGNGSHLASDGIDQDVRIGDIAVAEELMGSGEVHVTYLAANAEGSTIQWTPSTGTDNSALIDEVGGANDDTDYNSTGTSTNRDEIACENTSGSGTVGAVQGLIRIRKEGAETEQIKVGVKSSTTTSLSAAKAVAGTYDYVEGDLLELDPNTSSAWLSGAVDSAQLVYELS